MPKLIEKIINKNDDKLIYPSNNSLSSHIPTDPILDMVIWLDGNDLDTLWRDYSSGINAESGQPIERWDDKSGNNNHAFHVAGTNEFSVITRGNNTRVYTGATTMRMKINDDSSYKSDKITLFIVGRIRVDATGAENFIGYADSTIDGSTSTNFDWRWGFSEFQDDYIMKINNSTVHTLESVNFNSDFLGAYTSENAIYRSSGEEVYNGSGELITYPNVHGIQLGTASYCEIAEIIVYDYTLSEDQILHNESYLINKWSL